MRKRQFLLENVEFDVLWVTSKEAAEYLDLVLTKDTGLDVQLGFNIQLQLFPFKPNHA